MPIRIDKYIADALNVSRKQARILIAKGRVFVNEKPLFDSGTNIEDSVDSIMVDGQKINYQKYYYFLLNKPAGYISAKTDDKTPTVIDLFIGYERAELFPVGRLDKDTTGTMIITNNGLLTHRLINPKFNVEKEYAVTVNFPLKESLIHDFLTGFSINDEFMTKPAILTIIDDFHARVIMTEGKYHQIKRMFKHFGYEVMQLDRVRFATLSASDLALGSYRNLTIEEINKLFRIVNL